MKIEKLLTLSQFVKFIGTKRIHEFENINKAEKYKKIIEYDTFLNQPLTEEMFINPMDKDFYDKGHNAFDRDFREYEKKVIFEDVEILPYAKNSPLLDVFVSKKLIARTRSDKSWAFNNVTIGNLAEMTDGELKLKNVNI